MSTHEDVLSKRATNCFVRGEKELEHTLRCIESLKGEDWARTMLSKADHAFELSDWLRDHKENQTESAWSSKLKEMQALDAVFFALRFAYDLQKKGVVPKIECNSESCPLVYFEFSLDGANFFVNLLVTRRTDDLRDATTCDATGATVSQELRRIQEKIVRNVENCSSLKSKRTGSNYNVVIAETRGFTGSHLRQEERTQLVWGGKYFLTHRGAPELACWVESDSSKSLFVGLFDDEQPGAEAETFRSKVHLLGLVSEQSFGEGEVLKQIRLYQNPFIENSEDAMDAFYIASGQ